MKIFSKNYLKSNLLFKDVFNAKKKLSESTSSKKDSSQVTK